MTGRTGPGAGAEGGSSATPYRPERMRAARSVFRRYVLPRVATIALISLVVFLAANALGVDVAKRALGRTATPAELAAFDAKYGLNKPLIERYFTWIGHFVTGNWGISPISGQPIIHGVLTHAVATILLALGAVALALPVSISLGVFMAKRPGKYGDLVPSIGTLALAAAPVFVIGIVLTYVFSVQLGWTPVDSSGIAFGDFGDKVAAYVLPVVTLSLTLIPHWSRLTRAAFRETLSEPYAQAAVLRGLGRRRITWQYLMPNAAAPVVNVIALDLMWLVGGVVIAENVFGFPGLGSLLVNAIQDGDLVTVEAIALLTGILFVFISLAADLIVLLVNPRLRRQA